MWFKKKIYISGYNSNTAAVGIDLRTTSYSVSWSASLTPPSAADVYNYFYLPALGCYYSGQLSSVGSSGYYWSSSANQWLSGDGSYSLYFVSGGVGVSSSYRYAGYRAEALFE